jgi:hypothetical protein
MHNAPLVPHVGSNTDCYDGHAWIGPVFACLFILTILKGIRMPNRWSITHYLFTYQTGFMKRGLWGEVLHMGFGRWTSSYFFLATVGLVVFFAFLWFVWGACRRLPATADSVPFLLVFSASPALAYSAHMVGYLEQIGYLAVVLLLPLRRSWRWQVAWTIAMAAILPLIHEAAFLWVGCLSGLALLIGTAKPAARFRALVLVGAVWMVSTACVLRFGAVSPARAETVRADRTSFFEIRPRQDAFLTLTIPLRTEMMDMRARWNDAKIQLEMTASVLVFAPAWIFLGALAVRRANAIEGGGAVRLAAVTLTLAAATTPLLLHVVAWDRHRWNGLAALNAGLAALMLISASGSEARPRPAPWGRGLALALILAVWSISSDPAFFDRYDPRHPPFFHQIEFLVQAIRAPDRNLWIPVY